MEIRPGEDHRDRQAGRPVGHLASIRDHRRREVQAELQAQGAQAGDRVPEAPGEVQARHRR